MDDLDKDSGNKIPSEALEMPNLDDLNFNSSQSDSDDDDMLEEFKRETDKDLAEAKDREE